MYSTIAREIKENINKFYWNNKKRGNTKRTNLSSIKT